MSDFSRAEKSFSASHILVVDDHPLYCDAMVASLSSAFKIQKVDSVNSLEAAMKALAVGPLPDLVLLDLGLPDATGLSGFFQIKEHSQEMPIVVISADSSDETIHAAMEAGAMGFVPKDAPRNVIADALAQVQEGTRYLPPCYTPKPREAAQDPVSVQEASKRIARLTPQQRRIMELISAGKPNKLIAYELSVAEGTVKAHITALLRRLGVSNRTQAAVLVNSAVLGRSPSMAETDARAHIS
ncbi:response regulator [Loktanella sp. S4079]|uniref:response regulator n=1 Tax=Loktanella sp. S4079 TaxID=579483 RepID=UPI0005FA0EBC|nr:response regulator transcription factor [Loktanella sp. S4079]KJZ18208.1 LuxR family transcriptional regulator [Loktanella sp. S4079]